MRVEGNKSSFTFHNKPSNTILSATSIWDNIQIVKTCILKHNISNSISLTTRYLNFETLHHHFWHISNEFICHIFENIEDMKKIHFLTQKYICYSYTLKKMHQYSFSKNPVHSSKPHNWFNWILLCFLPCLIQITSRWLHSLMTIPLIATLLFCEKSLKLQNQWSQLSRCGQILLPIL